MKTVTSISGGKTSAYLYAHYPSDYNVFSLVCCDDAACGHPDPKLMQMANDRLQKYTPQWGEFIGTPEDPCIVKSIFDLEQKYGKEIIWLRGISFDQLCEKRSAIPNMMKRFCTTEMKLRPIFEWCHYWLGEKVYMNIGYRYDEKERKNSFTTEIKHAYRCDIGEKQNRHRWKIDEWRVGLFPLISDRITHYQVYQWSKTTGIEFAKDSNCQNCFWKDPQQLRKNFDNSTPQMRWAANLEKKIGRTFKTGMSLEQISEIGLQMDFVFGTGAGCSAGGCTD